MSADQYIDIYIPSHPYARSNGCVMEHILMAEKKLGRYIENGEVVHHIDENKHNNSIDNLMVFDSLESHARYHGGMYTSLFEIKDDVWTCTPMIETCNACGNTFIVNRNGSYKYCSRKCSELSQRKCDRPNKDELISLLFGNSFLSVGKMFGVSDNTIRKWCKSYGISHKSKDYKKLDNH